MSDPAHAHVRASDLDRQAVVDRLTTALVQGRISIEEFDHRSGAAYLAQTRGELALLVSDLPGHLW